MAKHKRKTSKRQSLAETTISLLMERSKPVVHKAKEILANEETKCRELREALHQTMQEWDNIKHPGLLSIACEAVGGSAEDSLTMQVPLLFLTAAIDMGTCSTVGVVMSTVLMPESFSISSRL